MILRIHPIYNYGKNPPPPPPHTHTFNVTLATFCFLSYFLSWSPYYCIRFKGKRTFSCAMFSLFTSLSTSFMLATLIHKRAKGLFGLKSELCLTKWNDFLLFLAFTLYVCSLFLLLWPSESRVWPEQGLCDLQLCLLSTQTSVRTAGRTRQGQTEDNVSTSHPIFFLQKSHDFEKKRHTFSKVNTKLINPFDQIKNTLCMCADTELWSQIKVSFLYWN